MELRKARPQELPEILAIIEGAKVHLREQGINQWQNGYPNLEQLIRDVEEECGYVAVQDDRLFGYFYLGRWEPLYAQLEGKWQFGEDYAVIHRIAFSADARGKGYSGPVFRMIEDLCRVQGISALRIDTSEANKKMQHILHKNGFVPRGIVLYPSGERIGFEKKIFLK